jgi:hypothetical protein
MHTLHRYLLGSSIAAAVLLAPAPFAAQAYDLSLYQQIDGGEWSRIANLKDAEGRFQARQEHTAIELNGFIYVLNGFVPAHPEPEPTEEDPEPFRFTATNEALVYVPRGHPARGGEADDAWRVLDESSWFPHDDYHHMMAATLNGEIWALGGHNGIRFYPADTIYVFEPNSEEDPDGTWRQIDTEGNTCQDGGDCLALPDPRAAGAAVSLGDTIVVLGGVVFNHGADDPNESIRATSSVIYLDTSERPLAWRDAPPMIEEREHFNAVVADGRIWVFHGRNGRTTNMRGVESWAPGEASWRQEPPAPIGTSANILAAIGECVYSFGGEFNANNVTGTVTASQVFHVPSRSWRLVESSFASEPLDAGGVISKHGTYGLVFEEDGQHKIMAPGGASLAWFAPMSRVHIFTPPESCQ